MGSSGDPMAVLPLNRSELKSTVERLLTKRRNKNRHCQPKAEQLGGRVAAEQGEAKAEMQPKETLAPKEGDKDPSPQLAKSPSMVVGAKHGDTPGESEGEDRREMWWRNKGGTQGQ